jgi:diaminopimelate epimerase
MTGNPNEQFIEVPLGNGLVGTAVSMGNPHLVIFVDDVKKVELESIGPKLEHYPDFPRRTNVHFIQVVDKEHLIQRTWERGAGITLACGTGACASGVAAFITQRADRVVQIQLPGGLLDIEYVEDGRVLMTGPAETVFEGEIQA